MMKANKYPNHFELVYCFFKKPIEQRGEDGFFYRVGYAKGILVKRTHTPNGEVWYHYPKDYLEWSKHLDIKTC